MATPYDNYIGIRLLHGGSINALISEIQQLNLPYVIPSHIAQDRNLTAQTKRFLACRENVMAIFEAVPDVLIKEELPIPAVNWARRRFLDPELLEEGSERFQQACEICHLPELKHILQLYLLDQSKQWDEVVAAVANYGRIEGLTQTAALDFQQLFWCFDSIPPTERSNFLQEAGASHGTYLALRGRSDVGLALDLGHPVEMSDLERYVYMRDLAFIRYVRGMELEDLSPREAVPLIEAIMALDYRIDQLREEARALEGDTIEAEFTVAYEDVPTIDDILALKQEQEEHDRTTSTIVPFSN